MPSSKLHNPPPATSVESTTNEQSPAQAAIERYLPYLLEIRKKILVVLVVFLIVGILTGINYQVLIKIALSGFNLTGINMVLTSPSQIIELGIVTGLFFGLITAAPFAVYYLLSFLKPALSPKEYKLVTSLLPISFLLFLVGFSFGIWVMKFVVGLFAETAIALNMSNLWDISLFFKQIILSGLFLGFLFQFPVVITALIRLKIISHRTLANQRVYVYTGILIVSAMLPPTDIFSLLLLTLPLFLLFEITLLLNKKA
jgi:sec-independent protein translocase protein TatC